MQDALNSALMECTFSTKSVHPVNVTVVKSATLNLTVKCLDYVTGVLYSSSRAFRRGCLSI